MVKLIQTVAEAAAFLAGVLARGGRIVIAGLAGTRKVSVVAVEGSPAPVVQAILPFNRLVLRTSSATSAGIRRGFRSDA